ncbi:dTMP kinase [Altererythrobacter sp. TH136]|uniref:dTMP kinase n=1 Tax=Altererythrobacter sp. TH136 TaxID=2067415 RepID=UPI001162139B|nr:dTMP kinase [Altererythrobacter sp. TH136]QDM39913.1 dTMP kinase [Altererythrobacter sp. TH136]
MTERGKFIAFEGGEGCGKSTQARILADRLRQLDIAVELTREPGGTPGAEAIRALLLDPPGDGWGPQAEALLFAAARADHVARRIMPALDAGQWVVCDRFVDSSRAYQGGAGGIGDEAVQTLHAIGSGGLRPDLTIFIAVPSEITAERLTKRDGDAADAIGGRSAAYHGAVADAFAQLAAAPGDTLVTIDGADTPEQVHAHVWRAVARLLHSA